jgi:hypothetical protein
MSIECGRRIDFLQNQCDQLGITVVPAGRKLMKDDLVKALRNHFIIERYGSVDDMPWHLKFMLSIECLQLCRRIKDLKPEKQAMLWSSKDWVAEEKVDGVRMAILWDANEKQFHFYSRNNSVTNYLPQDYSDTILVTSKDFYYPYSFVLDSEVISTNSELETNTQCLTQLQSTAALLNLNPDDSKRIQKNNPLKFVVFDCLCDGNNLIDSKWNIRHEHALKLSSMLKDSGFNCIINPVVENTDKYPDAKRDFFDRIVSNNGEGVVLKNKNAVYHATSSRTIDCVKVKRSTNDSLTKDLDAFITDYVIGKDDTRNENMIVGFVFSVKMEKPNGEVVTHPIAVCSNMSDFIKEDATMVNDKGEISLNPTYYGKVATLQGQNISARSLRLTHSIVDVWRPEKSAESCEVIKESELRKLIF